jgi:hypothetical protein
MKINVAVIFPPLDQPFWFALIVWDKSGMEFEYLVCQTQFSRVTFVNGAWQGTVALASGDWQAALDSCPLMWDYLALAGRDGWELVATTHSAITNSDTTSQLACQLFLKRQRR